MAIIDATQKNFKQEVLEAGTPVLVDFWAPWCGYCRRLAPVLERMDEEGVPYKIVKVNVDDAEALAQEYKVDTIPALFYFQGGRHGDALIAPGSRDAIEDWIGAQKKEC